MATKDYTVPPWDPLSEADNSADAEFWSRATAWDKVVIGGEEIRAIATVEGEKEERIDVKETPGTDGSTMTHSGARPGIVTIKLRFFSTDDATDYTRWMERLVELNPGEPGHPTPISLYHPGLAAVGIDALCLKSRSVPRAETPGGPWIAITRWIEFRPPKKVGFSSPLGTSQVHLGGPRAAQFEPKERKPSASPPGPDGGLSRLQ